jgi:hypothetical protein
MSEPIVLLSKEELGDKARAENADRIAKVVAAAQVKSKVVAVIAHRDCDAVEPAHEKRSEAIESELKKRGVPKPIAAVPAFETEAWWLLWPDAVASVRRCWERLPDSSRNVGSIKDAKENLVRALRPKKPSGKARCRDYEETDGIEIARAVRLMGIIDKRVGTSNSFERFRDKVRSI